MKFTKVKYLQNFVDLQYSNIPRFSLLCHHHTLIRVSGVFTLSWVPTNLAGKSQRGTCFRVIHMALVTGISIIDGVH